MKPGVDTAQFQSVIIQTEIDHLQTEKTYLQKLEELTRLTGMEVPAENVQLTDSTFKPLLNINDSFALTDHPLLLNLQAQKQTTEAGLREIQRGWVPQLDIWGNVYARGSGIDAGGVVNKSEGLGLSRTNAGVGLQLSFPVLQFGKVPC